MEEKTFYKLLDKYLTATATEQERALVEEYYKRLNTDVSDFHSLQNEPGIQQDMLDRIKAQMKTTAVVKLHKARVLSRLKYAVAASILLTLSVSTYWYINHHPNNFEASNKNLKHDFKPGGNKAILTLANGASIILDEAKKGVLASQGNAMIKKTKDGELVYAMQQVAAGDEPLTSQVVYNTISTPRGGQYQVILPDGTHVWLNAAASLKFPTAFSGSERRVELTGEAYFEVTKNKNMPFKVAVNDMQVQVLGTHFNVMAYNDEPNIQTTLLEGSVKITKGDKEALLKPGQQASVPFNGQNLIQVKDDPDAEEAAAWKDNYFIFNNENIQSIMKKIARWYDIDVSYRGKITDIGFNGTVSRSKNASDVFKILELTKAISFKIEGKKVTVIPSNYKTQSLNSPD